jgi:outer membrane protein assembly factor BamD
MLRFFTLQLLIFLLIFISACNSYNKLLKTDNLQLKYDKAIEFYEKKQYNKAYPLLEDLIIIYRGTPKAELLSFYHASCDFYLKDYTLASYRYNNFAQTYPFSKYAEEAKYKSAYCLYKNSPKYSLDQSSTYAAMESFQLFTNRYPESIYVDSCNIYIDKLRDKLQKKYFENAKQLLHMKNYKSAIVAFENLLDDFPGSKYTEEVNYLLVKTHFLLAQNSISVKKEERFNATLKVYIKFVDSFPKSKYISEVETYYNASKKELEKINN